MAISTLRRFINVVPHLSDEEIKKILYSNDSARYLVASEAEKIKLSQGTLAGILPTSVAYYITNDTK